MVSSKRHQKHGKAPLQMRTRTTRSKGRPLADPEQNTQQLTGQLRSLGLYAAHTLGDGNCLFRALSDQLYGSPSHHLQLRKDICDWIETHSQRYEPFCEDERGLTAHLRCMRERGTYGGHLELSAFAHFVRRNVKVVQPGLVYVIEWNAGGEAIADQSTSPAMQADSQPMEARERRRPRKQQQQREEVSEQEEASDTIYVAYYDWEHFSSIRNLRGPHTGLPNVCELPAGSEAIIPSPAKKKPPSSHAKAKPESKVTLKRSKNGQFTSTKVKIEETMVPTPTQIPLPMSRSPSPLSSAASLPQIDVDVLPPTPVTCQPENADSSLSPVLRVHRSPKRTFDESSGSSSLSDSIAKRTRSAHKPPPPGTQLRPDSKAIEVDDPEEEESTPDLSTPRSPASTRSSSVASSPLPGTPPPEPEPEPTPIEKPLTRRQRKALGLPKPRAALVGKRASAGKIIIPGGRFKRNVGATADNKGPTKIREVGDASVDDEGSVQEEWQRNGTGRLDVRGFRELKI
ncbi:cysteine proteinase [Imleria badia]|nr:cysteine proteinase [Imleria badia]